MAVSLPGQDGYFLWLRSRKAAISDEIANSTNRIKSKSYPFTQGCPDARNQHKYRHFMPDKMALTVFAHLLAVPLRFITDSAPDPVGPILS